MYVCMGGWDRERRGFASAGMHVVCIEAERQLWSLFFHCGFPSSGTDLTSSDWCGKWVLPVCEVSMAFPCTCHVYFVVSTLPVGPSCPLFADSPSPASVIISSIFMSYVSCCSSGLRFRSARNPMAGEELQPRGRTLTQEAEGPGVQSTVPEWLEEGRARGSKGCFVFWMFFCYPFPFYFLPPLLTSCSATILDLCITFIT